MVGTSIIFFLKSTHFCPGSSTDDVTCINFRFQFLVTWSSSYGVGASSHEIWLKCLYSNGRYDISGISIWRPPPSWISKQGETCTFRHDSRLTLPVCIKSGLNVYYNRWHLLTFITDVRLMTSCKLTSGSDVWSCDHLFMALLHLPTNFGANTFIRSWDIDIFRNSIWRPSPCLIFCRAMLCKRGLSRYAVSVCLSVYPSRSYIL